MKTRLIVLTALGAASMATSACSSPEEEAENWQAEEERQQQLVERAVRRAYEDEGAEIVELEMQRTEDGSQYEGRARVRDPENGEELIVDCTVYADARGAPQLECNRAADQEQAGD